MTDQPAKDAFIRSMDQTLKLVRTEYGLTQEAMARALGLSKKTLVEIEKGRSSLGWMGSVALCALFDHSQVLGRLLGGPAGEILQALAFQDLTPTYPPTMGGRVWWRTVETIGRFRIQQNLISQHYRALDPSDGRICSSFDLDEIRRQLRLLTEDAYES